MPKEIDLTGKKYGRLTVLKKDGHIGGKIAWLCKCDCGNTKRMIGSNLGRLSNSCGCVRTSKFIERSTKHGYSNERLYYIWIHMKQRCSDPKDIKYKNYGGRGITVCKEWENSFEKFYNWSIENKYSSELTLDRKDNNGNYSPENCRWATVKEQNNNKRNNRLVSYNGKTMTVSQWAEISGIRYDTLLSRIKVLKWDIEKAIKTPVKKYNHRNITAKERR